MDEVIVSLKKPIHLKTEGNETIGNNEMTNDTERYVRALPKVYVIEGEIEHHLNKDRHIPKNWYFEYKDKATNFFQKNRIEEE